MTEPANNSQNAEQAESQDAVTITAPAPAPAEPAVAQTEVDAGVEDDAIVEAPAAPALEGDDGSDVAPDGPSTGEITFDEDRSCTEISGNDDASTNEGNSTNVEGSSGADQNEEAQDKWWWDNTDNKGLLGFNPTALNNGTFEWPKADWLTEYGIGTGAEQYLLKNIQLRAPGVLDLKDHENLFPSKDSSTEAPKAIDTIEFLGAGENTVQSNENIRIDRIKAPGGQLNLEGVTNDNLKVDSTFHGVLDLTNCNFQTFDFSQMQDDVEIHIDADTWEKFKAQGNFQDDMTAIHALKFMPKQAERIYITNSNGTISDASIKRIIETNSPGAPNVPESPDPNPQAALRRGKDFSNFA